MCTKKFLNVFVGIMIFACIGIVVWAAETQTDVLHRYAKHFGLKISEIINPSDVLLTEEGKLKVTRTRFYDFFNDAPIEIDRIVDVYSATMEIRSSTDIRLKIVKQ